MCEKTISLSIVLLLTSIFFFSVVSKKSDKFDASQIEATDWPHVVGRRRGHEVREDEAFRLSDPRRELNWTFYLPFASEERERWRTLFFSFRFVRRRLENSSSFIFSTCVGWALSCLCCLPSRTHVNTPIVFTSSWTFVRPLPHYEVIIECIWAVQLTL